MRDCARLIFLVSILAFGARSFAYQTNLNDNHSGLAFAVGTLDPSANANFDPITSMGPAGTRFSGTTDFRLMHYKLGAFRDLQKTYMEIYGLHMRNTVSTWSVAGSFSGSGKTNVSGKGVGISTALRMAGDARFRLMADFSAEYVWVTGKIVMDTPSTILLTTKAINIGAGLRGEVWLGDMWTLSILGAYKYGIAQPWEVYEASSVMSTRYAQGVLQNRDGSTVNSNFGGMYGEASLHLSFY